LSPGARNISNNQEPDPAQNAEEAGTRRRYWIIGILVVLGIVFFTAGKFGSVIRPTLKMLTASRDKKATEAIHEDLYRMFEEYGVERRWVSERRIEMTDSTYLRDEWTITIPRNMPLATLNHDIRMYMEDKGGGVYAFENARTAQLFMHLSAQGRIFLTLVFTASKDIQREGGNIAMLVDGIDNASSGEINQLSLSKDPIACIIVPDRDIVQVYDKLATSGREIVLHVHVSPQRQVSNRFALSDDMKDAELLQKVRNVAKNFPAARFFFITSERMNAGNTELIADEFRKNGLVRIESSSLLYIDRADEEVNMAARINDLSTIAVRNGRAFGVAQLTSGRMEFLTDQISRLRKRGFVFETLKQAMSF
jgi:polysaccharide deacetylase 2 family uncharacterized protein YibQ